jgi:hypothetical protein
VSLTPSRLTVAGATLDLHEVLADVTVRHGRADVMDDPTPSTCQVTLLDVDHAFVKAFQIRQPLVFSARDGGGAEKPRFTGTITDAALDENRLTAMAVGPLATFDQYPIGAADWPAETWSARVTRCFTEAGLASLLVLQKAAFDPLLVARTAATAGPTTLRDYLGFLAPMVGAAVVDRPDGKVLVQAIGARTIASSTRLDPALVEYVPNWVQDLPHGNVVTVRYTGDQSMSVTVQAPSSIAVYGRRPITIDTTFANLGDATERANERLARTSFSHWNMPSAPVLAGLELAIGTPVQLDTFPASAPFDPWQPILEGWTDHIAGADWTMELALSDPLASGLLLPWNAVPTVGYAWNQINQATPWKDALTIGDLA